MRKLLFLFSILIGITFSSCRKDFSFEQSNGGLEFSKNTVYLDTVFTNIASSTYRLKVYNRGSKDIVIPKIQLGKGINSKYRIMVDGMIGDAGAIGKSYSNVELLAKDSLFIFIEVTADITSANPTDFLYTDQIEFTNVVGAPQTVDLVTLIQDAIFIYPDKPLDTGIIETLSLSGETTNIKGHELSGSQLTFSKDKPYVIYGYALVPNGQTLNINPGAKVYFHANSGIIIDKQGTLNINGELSDYNLQGEITNDKEVRFEGDRLEPAFEDVPGQWFGILILSQNNNIIKHLTLKNSTVGIYCAPLDATGTNFYQAKLNISNSQIYNNSNFGMYSLGAQINGDNLVINYCGQYGLACTFGGNYSFTHCTFNNNWNSSKQLAVCINNFIRNDDGTVAEIKPINYNFTNSIIYGSNQVELGIESAGVDVTIDNHFNNCLFKYNSSQLPIFLQNNNIFGNIRNLDPKFKNIDKNQLQPQTITSGAYQKGMTTNFLNDILGMSRSIPPDLGAYNVAP